MSSFKPLIPLTLAVLLCSCAGLSPPREAGEAQETQAGAESPEAGPPYRVPVRDLERENAGNIEIIWQAPGGQPQAFVIRYGTSPAALTEEKRVETAEIEKTLDRDFGLVYRYVLKDVSPGRDIYVSISSIDGGAVSEPSSVFQVKAEETAPGAESPKNTQELPSL